MPRLKKKRKQQDALSASRASSGNRVRKAIRLSSPLRLNSFRMKNFAKLPRARSQQKIPPFANLQVQAPDACCNG